MKQALTKGDSLHEKSTTAAAGVNEWIRPTELESMARRITDSADGCSSKPPLSEPCAETFKTGDSGDAVFFAILVIAFRAAIDEVHHEIAAKLLCRKWKMFS